MERTLFNRNGDPIDYISHDYNSTIYLVDGLAVAYIYEDMHVYGINGRHLGWFVNDMVFSNIGERIGFTSGTCPVAVAPEPVKAEKQDKDELRARWEAPPFPELTFDYAARDLEAFLREGQIVKPGKHEPNNEEI